eukprot:TRINITY_DN16362_c0_g1_i1.p1 TRINITY_DN16362_c0_g1~~TRINITY_DN16362_c0_g1_i1.p1  ORF type:complete len:162 (-),score=9.43 TRINITY_DN16362_c0_g1_i1:99-584(-)
MEQNEKMDCYVVRYSRGIMRKNKVGKSLRLEYNDLDHKLLLFLTGNKNLICFTYFKGFMKFYKYNKGKYLKHVKIPRRASIVSASLAVNQTLLISMSDNNKFNNSLYMYKWISNTVINDEPFKGHAHRILYHKYYKETAELITVSEDAKIINTKLLSLKGI